MKKYTSEELRQMECEIAELYRVSGTLSNDQKNDASEKREELKILIYNNCEEANYFSHYSPFSVYKNFYELRLKSYLRKFNDVDVLDFIYKEKDEIEEILDSLEDLDEEGPLNIMYSGYKKIDFLNKKEKELGLNFNNGENDSIALSDRNKRTSDIVEFSDFFDAENKRLVPFLSEIYKDAEAREYAFMILALCDLKIIDDKLRYENITQLHRIMSKHFGDVGVRYGLSKHLKNEKRNEKQIAYHMERISSWLKEG